MRLTWFSLVIAMFLLGACAQGGGGGGGAGGGSGAGAGSGDGTQTEGMAADGTPLPSEDAIANFNVSDRVFFGTDSHTVDPQSQLILRQQAQFLEQYPSLIVTIEGHADERGTREYNLALGERRATAVREYLLSLGIDPSRVQILSYGKERPAVLGTGEEVWAQNRRGVTVLN